jgi:acetyl-CoA decarbonylase/synthase complex subunit gamma
MALTGLDIYKLLPKKNCGECGSPTCLAFAMKLAAKKVSLEDCPYVSEEAKAALGSASRPPIRLVKIGAGDGLVELGNETVLFRHEETFYHEPAVAIRIREDDPSAGERIELVKKLQFERVGMEIGVNLVALEESSGDPDRYAAFAAEMAASSDLGLVLISSSADCLRAALEKVKERRPLLYAAEQGNYRELAELARESGSPLVVKGTGLEETAELAEGIAKLGAEDLILDTSPPGLRQALFDQTAIRRQAVKKAYRPLGYPTLAFTSGRDKFTDALEAAVGVSKYVSVLITDLIEPEYILPILTARQNIYTNPQKPIQVEPKLYPIGSPDDHSPVLVTTNFSLTYFTVAGEIEASRISAHLLIVDTEGTSVLTAWAADKFNAKTIAAALEKNQVAERVGHKNLIIPGYVAVLSGKLEEESGWDILVGPKEASGIPKFLETAMGKTS